MRIFRLSVLLAMMSVAMCAGARSFKVDDYRFTVLDEDARTVSLSSDVMLQGVVKLPATVTYEDITYRVTEIGRYAFESSLYMDALIIPKSVTRMCSGALTGCSPKLIVYGENLLQVDDPEDVKSDLAVFLTYKRPDYADLVKWNIAFDGRGHYSASKVRLIDAEPYITDDGMIYMVGDEAATLIGVLDPDAVHSFTPGELTLNDGRTVRVERLATNSLMGCTLGEVRIDDGIDFFVERDAFDVADVVYFGDRTYMEIKSDNVTGRKKPWEMLRVRDLTMKMIQDVNDLWIEDMWVSDGTTFYARPEIFTLDICGKINGASIHVTDKLIIGKDVSNIGGSWLGRPKEVIFEDSEKILPVYNSVGGGISFRSNTERLYLGRDIDAHVVQSSNPFQSMSDLKEATVAGYATTMPESSFYSCHKLRHLTLGENITTIPYHCIYELSVLERLDCLAPVPPVCDANSMNIYYDYCRLYVPEESYEAYRTTEPWSRFVYINDINGAVETLSADNAAVVATEWYDMQGRRLECQPSAGVAIRQDRAADGTVSCHKVIIRE